MLVYGQSLHNPKIRIALTYKDQLMNKTPDFPSFDSLPVPEGREAYLQDVWLKSRLFYLRMTHPVDDVVALMEEFETGVTLRRDN